MSAFSTMSSASSSSYIPASPCSPGLTSSPSTYSLSTPPDSIRQYSTALKAKMVAGMRSAMADMVDESREAERQFDTEFGYDDEDPIDRHVRMFLTPRKARVSAVNIEERAKDGLGISMEMDVDQTHPQPRLLVDSADKGKRAVDEEVKPFQPGLIHFHRTHSQSSRNSAPSFSRTDSEYRGGSTSGSNPCTPFDLPGVGTPGSDWSEASFEAVKSEDYVSMYGSYSSSTGTGVDRSSMASTITTLSTATIKPTPRPSLARPRPRANVAPYPGSFEMRAREREHSGGEPGKILPGTPIDDVMEDDWLQGRTISETMIAQAGLRCQRGRVNRR